MAKQTVYSNYRVEVRPSQPPYGVHRSHDGWLNVCHRIAQEVRRHVDRFESARNAFDSADVCSFCGEPWGRVTVRGGQFCCDKADEEFEARDHGKE